MISGFSGYLDYRSAVWNCQFAPYPSHALDCPFLPVGSGKTEAIKALSEASGIDPADTAAFGDDQNDLEMLRICGKGVAVANAVQEVKEAADAVTLSNDEDGVARWLLSNCLSNTAAGDE